MSETFQFFERLEQVRENPADPNHEEVLQTATNLVRILLHGPYLRSLKLEEPFRDEQLPEWQLIHQHIARYDSASDDPQPLELRGPLLDYDAEADEFFFPLYGPDTDQAARKVPTLQDLLQTWNRFRIGDFSDPLKHYTPGAYAVLDALTSMDPTAAPWIAHINDVWHVRGIPTNLRHPQILETSRGGLWEATTLESSWPLYRGSTSATPEEANITDIRTLASNWRASHRNGDGPLFAQDLRRAAYQKWDEQFKDQEIVHTLPDGTRVTLGMLERLIRAERLELTKEALRGINIHGTGDKPSAKEMLEFVSPFEEDEEDKPGKSAGEGECV